MTDKTTPIIGGMNVTISPLVPGPRSERALHARSPARAKRRAARGYEQHFIWRDIPGEVVAMGGHLYCHPDTWAQLKEMIANG